MRECSLGPVTREVAFFAVDNAEFALLPGGEASLGFDVSRWNPSDTELDSYQGTVDEFGMDGLTIKEYVASVVRAPQKVTLDPILFETTAGETGWNQLDAHDPRVTEALAKFPNGVEIFGPPALRIRRDPDGQVIAHESEVITHSSVSSKLQQDGFRLPTSDEWEYACGAGSPCLFRWGNYVPGDILPTETSSKKSAWRPGWLRRLGKPPRPSLDFGKTWDLHRHRNAFGLAIAENPYNYEMVAENGMTRGGDGGTSICGGLGLFVSWLPLATAYVAEHDCIHTSLMPGYVVHRRVLSLV